MGRPLRGAAAYAGGAGLLASAGVAVQRAALDGLVDRPHQRAVLGLDALVVALGDSRSSRWKYVLICDV